MDTFVRYLDHGCTVTTDVTLMLINATGKLVILENKPTPRTLN
jgi:hypothetical protein